MKKTLSHLFNQNKSFSYRQKVSSCRMAKLFLSDHKYAILIFNITRLLISVTYFGMNKTCNKRQIVMGLTYK